ncbi:hypothetical protein KFK14_00375 [Sphingobium phenoxybenzoativorans]|uniref:Uncharacterized protein n=1 Tax=Sphingobium phenoxybenzoativorans TaxID=1592790 RepID=A0A975K7V8_9SPHN|nr:hypothetical protein [Sphingobium phenoxybenzoativorans]QUT06004.1 hypothetical protein KFK14_00375 [Sphingobium phenoxybenzoativorans]
MDNTLPRRGEKRPNGRLTGAQTVLLAPLALWFALSYMARSWLTAGRSEQD